MQFKEFEKTLKFISYPDTIYYIIIENNRLFDSINKIAAGEILTTLKSILIQV